MIKIKIIFNENENEFVVLRNNKTGEWFLLKRVGLGIKENCFLQEEEKREIKKKVKGLIPSKNCQFCIVFCTTDNEEIQIGLGLLTILVPLNLVTTIIQ